MPQFGEIAIIDSEFDEYNIPDVMECGDNAVENNEEWKEAA